MNSEQTLVVPNRATGSRNKSMTRLRYCLHLCALTAGLLCLALLLLLATTIAHGANENNLLLGLAFVLIVSAVLLSIILNLRWTCLRIRDVGYSGWYILLGLIPVVGSLLQILIYFVPSNYRQTRKKDRWMALGLTLCGVYLILMFFCILASLKSTGPLEKRDIDERVSVVAPVGFEPVAFSKKDFTSETRALIVNEHAWQAAFGDAEVVIAKCQYQQSVTPSLRDALLAISSEDSDFPGPANGTFNQKRALEPKPSLTAALPGAAGLQPPATRGNRLGR